MTMRLFLTIFAIFLATLFVAPNASADCVLSSPNWPSGSKRIGETFTVSVEVNGCGSEGTLQFRVYDDDGPLDDLIREWSLPTRNGTITQSFALNSNDWEQAGGRIEGPLELYFEAKSCVSSICSNTATSHQVILEVDTLPDDLPTPTRSRAPGQPITASYSFQNPLGPDGPTNLLQLIEKVARWIMALAIPVAVIMIIYGGLLFLTAGQKPDNVKRGKEILKYAIIGLAIVLIGNGFVSLVRSVIELGGSDAPETQQP